MTCTMPRALDLVYTPYELAEDEWAQQFFHNLCDDLLAINEESVHLIILRSRVQKIQRQKINGHSYIIWDLNYWEFFEKFLDILLFIETSSDVPEHFKCKEDLLFRTLDFFFNSEDNYLLRKPEDYQIRNDYEYKSNPHELGKLVKYAKAMVMYHEFEHILNELCPEVYMNDMTALDYLIDKAKEHIVKTSLAKLDSSDKFKEICKGLELLKNNVEWLPLKNELFYDVHAFIEISLGMNFLFAFSKDKATKFPLITPPQMPEEYPGDNKIVFPSVIKPSNEDSTKYELIPHEKVMAQACDFLYSVKALNLFRSFHSVVPIFNDVYFERTVCQDGNYDKYLNKHSRDVIYRQDLSELVLQQYLFEYNAYHVPGLSILNMCRDKMESLMNIYNSYAKPITDTLIDVLKNSLVYEEEKDNVNKSYQQRKNG